MPDQPTPEQIKAFQEKLEKMSPEEKKQFFRQQCIFCQIIDGKVDAKKIYEDEKSLAILDINPASQGHILLLPKEHYQVGPQVPEEEMKHLGKVTKALSNAVLKNLDAKGTNVFVANGVPAGQNAQHFMIHIIPRKEGDGLENFNLKGQPAQGLSELALNLRQYIGKKLGITITEDTAASTAKEQTLEKRNEQPEKIKEEDLPSEKKDESIVDKKEKEPKKDDEKKQSNQQPKKTNLDDISSLFT